MEKIKVAILGARGIGRFHFREFNAAGADVAAILGSNQRSAEETSEMLYRLNGVRPIPYSELERMLERESLDAVSICTPPGMHYGYSKICLNAGLHVLCEKPLVLNRDFPNYDDAQEILSIAKARQRVITVNTQWPAIRHLISAHANCSKPRRFSMYVEPGTVGVDMLTDFLPHTNSLLISLFGGGDIEGLKFHVSDGEEIRISFDYHRGKNRCKTSYYLKYRSDRPRALNVAVNGVWFRRFIEEGYRQGFEVGGERFYIEDPFRTSIRKFLGAINEQDNCLVSYDEILANVKMQDEIVSEYARRKL